MYSKSTNRTELSITMKQKALRSHSIYIYIYKPKNISEREATRMFLNSQIKNLLLSRSIATTHVLIRHISQKYR